MELLPTPLGVQDGQTRGMKIRGDDALLALTAEEEVAVLLAVRLQADVGAEGRHRSASQALAQVGDKFIEGEVEDVQVALGP
jgi:hypothetical protein